MATSEPDSDFDREPWDDGFSFDCFEDSPLAAMQDEACRHGTRSFRALVARSFRSRWRELRPVRTAVAIFCAVAGILVGAAVALALPGGVRTAICLGVAPFAGFVGVVWLTSRLTWRLRREGPPRRVWPIGPSSQLVFAEALRVALVECLPIDSALKLAIDVTPRHDLRLALRDVRWSVRSGHSLASSLEQANIRADKGLLAAFSVGEEFGCLTDELATFTRSRGLTVKQFHAAIGRSPAACRFAATLARLLEGRRLTPAVIAAAGRSAAAGARSFDRRIASIVEKVSDGTSLADALRRHPGDFDTLFCGLVAHAASREELRACLERLGSITEPWLVRRPFLAEPNVALDRPRYRSGDPAALAELSRKQPPAAPAQLLEELRIVFATLEPAVDDPPDPPSG
jgi:hypothetical protein